MPPKSPDKRLASMKIHHLNCGTCCPLGGRLFDGTSHGILRGHIVCHCLLVESSAGLILVDTGFGRGDVARPDRLSAFFRFANQPQLRERRLRFRRFARWVSIRAKYGTSWSPTSTSITLEGLRISPTPRFIFSRAKKRSPTNDAVARSSAPAATAPRNGMASRTGNSTRRAAATAGTVSMRCATLTAFRPSSCSSLCRDTLGGIAGCDRHRERLDASRWRRLLPPRRNRLGKTPMSAGDAFLPDDDGGRSPSTARQSAAASRPRHEPRRRYILCP